MPKRKKKSNGMRQVKKNLKRTKTRKGGKKGITEGKLLSWAKAESKMAKEFREHGLPAMAKHDAQHAVLFKKEAARRKVAKKKK